MSKYATPFILLNLGSEMLFVVSQRLKAQNVSNERTSHVLDEITSSLINQQLITELLNDQNLINHDQMKELIDNIAQSSIMRLDETSMDRLWDLITMIFKWQLSLSQDLFVITIRHLYEIETFTTNPATQLQLHRVQTTIDNFAKCLTNSEKVDLFEHVMMWLRDFHIRVSLLLRLGFQHPDGSFKRDNFPPKYAKMVDNLGENIYAVSSKFNLQTKKETSANEKYELNTMYEQLLGPKHAIVPDNNNKAQFFKLSLCEDLLVDDRVERELGADVLYSHINVESSSSFDVFNVGDEQEDVSIHEELLNILDEHL